MTPKESESRPLTWNDIASPKWFPNGQLGTVRISAFLMMNADPSQISPEPVIMDFGDARVLAFYGHMPYLRLSTYEIRNTIPPQIHLAPEQVTSPEGAYVLIVLPLENSEPSASEYRIRTRVTEIAGLLVAVFGPNIAYRRLFDNIIRPQSNERTVIGDFFRAPGSMPAPDISEAKIRLTSDAYEAIKRLPPNDRNRVSLSLRWYSEAQYASGADLFLKLWFAIEALGMSERNNVRPVVEVLARSYGIAYDEAKQRFMVGRLFGFRSRIVHQGQILPIHFRLADYVAAIYLDVLYERLNLPPGGFAEKVQQSGDVDFNALTR